MITFIYLVKCQSSLTILAVCNHWTRMSSRSSSGKIVQGFKDGIILLAIAGPLCFLMAYGVFQAVSFFSYGGFSGVSDFFSAGDNSDPASESVIAVKESSSGPTVGIVGSQKGKPAYLYIPPKKEYEVTYEEDGVLKTKTMSKDPTK